MDAPPWQEVRREGPCLLTLGNFDGIHRGHRHILEILSNSAREQNLPACLLSFHPHPAEFFTSGKGPALLSPPEEKDALVRELGVEPIWMRFDASLAQMEPPDFLERVLVERLGAQSMVVGPDHRFGRARLGDRESMRVFFAAKGQEVKLVDSLMEGGEQISSSRIRQLLESGRLDVANGLLGRNYSLTGRVVGGQKRGRRLGFPTANLELPPRKLLPAFGVYGIEAKWRDGGAKGILNVGMNPTFSENLPKVEAHLFDFSQDLYGQTLTIKLVLHVRNEKKFESAEQLVRQIQLDVEKCKAAFAD